MVAEFFRVEVTPSPTSILAPRLSDSSYPELRRVFGTTRSLYYVGVIPTSTFSFSSPGMC